MRWGVTLIKLGMLVVIALAACGALAGGALAANIPVTTTADDSTDDTVCSLREAVRSADTDSNAFDTACVAGEAGIRDVIMLQAGTYELLGATGEDGNAQGDFDIVPSTGGITIEGQGATATTIDAAGNDRVFHVTANSGGGLTLEDLKIINGEPGSDGGAIYNEMSSPLILDRVVLTGNESSANGGAIRFGNAISIAESLTIRDSTLNGNVAAVGGALDVNTNGDVTITRSTFDGNTADYDSAIGGGLRLFSSDNSALVSITDSSIRNNHVTATGLAAFDYGRGGGIDHYYSKLRISGTTISGNTVSAASMTAQAAGGGLFSDGAAELQLSNSTVAANSVSSAQGTGGALHIDEDFGGTVASLVHLTLAGNTAPTSPQIAQESDPVINVRGSLLDPAGTGACATGITSAGNNVASGNGCGLNAATDLQGASVLLGPLAANGGKQAGAPGATVAIPTRLPLAGSAAIDAIPTASCTDGNLLEPAGTQAITADQRGEARPTGPACDAGAAEARITCAGKVATLIGSLGNSVVAGTNKADVILDPSGADRIRARGGKDTVCGGKGNDRINGGKGRDLLLGGAGRDILIGGPGRDKLRGGPGRDTQRQ